MMNKHLAVCAIPTVTLVVMSYAAASPPSSEAAAIQIRFRQLERDIPSLYLINGLYLNRDQAAKLSALLDKAYESNNRFATAMDRLLAEHDAEFRREEEEIVRLTLNGKPLEQAGKRGLRVRRLADTRRAVRDLRNQRRAEQETLADAVYDLLTPSQRKTVDGFNPCFIPARDFRNPERVGQAVTDTAFVERILARLRNTLSDDDAGDATDRALAVLVPYVLEKRHVPYSQEAEQEVRDELSRRLASLLPQVRSMADADFEIDKGKLAACLVPPPHAEDPAAQRWKLAFYVLHPGIRDVMRARAGLTEATGASPRAEPTCVRDALGSRTLYQAAVLLRNLGLSREQSVRLLDVIHAALAAREKIEAQTVEAMKKALGPYQRLRSELAAGQPTERTENEANRAHRAVKALRNERLTEELLRYEAEVDRILTVKQVERLVSGVGPGNGQAQRASDTTSDRLLERARRLLSDARRASGLHFDREKEILYKRFLDEAVAQDGLDAQHIDEQAEIQRAGEILERARKMSNEEFARQRDELAVALCPRRSVPRDPTYGARYVRGKPVRVLSDSSRLLFSAEACRILEGLVKQQS